MEERQTNYTIAEGYELPSKGLIYDKPVNSHVELRSMTARDEMKRLGPSTAQFKVLSDIIEGCMIEKPAIHVYDMALGDYEYLLHRLRVISYGDSYKMTIQCPNCGKIIDAEAHLNDLVPKDFNMTTFKKLKVITLPDCKKVITLKLQTPRVLDEIESSVKEFRKRNRDADFDVRTFIQLLTAIESIEDMDLKPYELENFVNKLSAKDMYYILQSVDKLNNSIGLDTRLTVFCDECGEEIDTFFRIGPKFLRPDVI